MSFEENIKKNNIKLPKAVDPVGSYIAAKISGKCYSSLAKSLLMKMVI